MGWMGTHLPSPSVGWGTSPHWNCMGVPSVETGWGYPLAYQADGGIRSSGLDGGTQHRLDEVPLAVDWQTPVKTVPSRRTTYEGGKETNELANSYILRKVQRRLDCNKFQIISISPYEGTVNICEPNIKMVKTFCCDSCTEIVVSHTLTSFEQEL